MTRQFSGWRQLARALAIAIGVVMLSAFYWWSAVVEPIAYAVRSAFGW